MGTQWGPPQTQPRCWHHPAVLETLGPRHQDLKDPTHQEVSSGEPPLGLATACWAPTHLQADSLQGQGAEAPRAGSAPGPTQPNLGPSSMWTQAARARPLPACCPWRAEG